MVSNVVWLEKRIRYIEGLKSPNENQQTLMELAGKAERTPQEERIFKNAVKREKLNEQTAKAKAESKMLKNSAKQAERKSRDHELYKSAGILLIGSGLVDTKTGTSNWRAEQHSSRVFTRPVVSPSDTTVN